VSHVATFAVYVIVPEFAPVAQLTQALFISSQEYPSTVEQPVQATALTVTVHVSHPIKPPVYPVAGAEQETQILLVVSRPYPVLHASQSVGVLASHDSQLAI